MTFNITYLNTFQLHFRNLEYLSICFKVSEVQLKCVYLLNVIVDTTVVIERVMNKKRVVHRDQSQLLTTELCMLVEPQTITNTFIL